VFVNLELRLIKISTNPSEHWATIVFVSRLIFGYLTIHLHERQAHFLTLGTVRVTLPELHVNVMSCVVRFPADLQQLHCRRTNGERSKCTSSELHLPLHACTMNFIWQPSLRFTVRSRFCTRQALRCASMLTGDANNTNAQMRYTPCKTLISIC
jgi:hypothetical protein